MKLRLEKELVRLRLSPVEIDLLNSKKSISEKISISNENEFNFSINIVGQIENCMVVFNTNAMDISVPNTIANKWIGTNQIGIKEIIVTDDGGSIVLIVEEDLPPRKNKGKK
jgi:hypothetical protein